MKELIHKDKQKLIYIQWQDAHANGGWFTEQQLIDNIKRDAFICEEVGWVVYEDDKEIHLCGRRGRWSKLDFVDKTSEYGMYQRIPKTWVLKRKALRI